MRWFLQIGTMIGDLVVLAAVGYVLYAEFSLFTLILGGAVLKAWYNTGAFEAWKPSVIRRFFKNAKEIGL